MAEKDLYEVLGVQKNASQDDIKRAFRRLAKKYHPDKHKGDKGAEERFKEISAAYDVVGDPEKRREYDQMRDAMAHGFTGFSDRPFTQRSYAGGSPFDDLRSRFRGSNAGWADFFSELFGRRAAAHRTPVRGRDIFYTIDVPFNLAVKGGKSALTFPSTVQCPACKGSGAAPDGKVRTCATCHGSGSYVEDQGGFAFTRVCPTCFGRGQTVDKPCPKCNGSAEIRKKRRVEVKIPMGISDGAKIRIPKMGEPGEGGGSPGDLFIVVHISTPQGFRRDGLDMHTDVQIPLTSAVLGAKVDVHTVHGSLTVTIPPGTQPGASLRLRGKGLSSPSGAVGDHYVHVLVRVPKHLTPRQKELFEALAQTGDL